VINVLPDTGGGGHIGIVNPAAARALRVLVADDERSIADSLERLLVLEGHEVRVAYDGAEVLSAARRFDPEVAILDIDMPKLGGYDVARALRARHSGIVLVALTGWKQGTDKIFARMAGFDHHFGKPCDPRALTDLLATLAQRA
jgi:DNA-binding response OmpR family regulator